MGRATEHLAEHLGGFAKAVIYDSSTQSLIVSAQGNLPGPMITLPISTTLVSGREYRIGFYGQLGSGTFFLPDSTPYLTDQTLLSRLVPRTIRAIQRPADLSRDRIDYSVR